MPLKRCEEEGQRGWKWGDTGKCYLYSDEESEKAARKKALAQGIAMGDIEPENAAELAEIIDVPVLTAGDFVSHNAGPLSISDEELDEIIEGSNVLQPLIREAIESGQYRGNEEVTTKLTKPIPGLINLKHQGILPQTLKDAVKGVSTEFRKAIIDGKEWIVQRFRDVPNDIAQTIQREFPFRSVELLPLRHPETGKLYSKVIRSTAFLDRFTPPAVPGQSPELVVEFSAEQEPLTILTCVQRRSIMPEETKIKAADASELQALKDAHAAQESQIAELKAKFDKAEAERQKAIELAMKQEQEKDAKIAELQAKQDAADADKIIAELSKIRTYQDRAYQISPAFLEVIQPVIKSNGVFELAEGENQRAKLAGMFDQIAELAAKSAVVVPLSTQGAMSYQPPDKKVSKEELIQELMKSEGLSESEAWVKATDQLGEYK